MRAIAMKCTQEDWDSIKPILEDNDIIIEYKSSFYNGDYLVTNFKGDLGHVSNVTVPENFEREVYHEWDQKIFLEALDIKSTYTIDDVRNGKCAILNDGTLEELRTVLKIAFPKDEYPASGTSEYYFRDNYRHHLWIWCDVTNLPTQSVKEFLKNINMSKQTNQQSLTMGQLRNLYKVSDCSEWRNAIATYISTFDSDDVVVYIKDADIDRAKRKATNSQLNALKECGIVLEESCPYKDGELIWVNSNGVWELRYSTGELISGRAKCYDSQAKSGFYGTYANHRPAPGIKLPDND